MDGIMRDVFHKWELQILLERAKKYKDIETGGTMLPVKRVYRNKPREYFEHIRRNRKNIMEVYTKDNNGDPRCPINGKIDGLFFGVRPDPSTMDIPNVSPFGEMRITIPVDALVNLSTRLYFADFYCHNKIHYVTLVTTQPNTIQDIFCRNHLPELSFVTNPFWIRQTAVTIWGKTSDKAMFYCCEEPRVEVFHTQDVDLEEDYIEWDTVKTIGRGHSTPGGIPKRLGCSTCNL